MTIVLIQHLLQIGKTSGLVLTLTGILKNVLLIVASVIIWHNTITFIQFLGYAIAVGGLIVYSDSVKWEHVQKVQTWVKDKLEHPHLDESGLSPLVRRTLIIALGLVIVIMLFIGVNYDASTASVST